MREQDHHGCPGEKKIRGRMENVTSGKRQAGSLSKVISLAIEKELPMALWRLPQSKVSTLIVSATATQLTKEDVLEELPPGFIFAPYRDDQPTVFIEGDLRFRVEGDRITGPVAGLEAITRAQDSVRTRQSETNSLTEDTRINASAGEKEAYLDLVSKSIEAIAGGQFEKVVPSRVKRVELPGHFDCVATYKKLCDDHHEALISLVHIPGAGTWMGASPEVLVSVEDGRTFRTVALAGTQPHHEGTSIKSVAWTQKEIEEQALVERYIISCFKRIRLREYDEHGPKTVIAGNLMHLRSDFTVDMRATGFPQLGSVMLNLLHPTSAVCGMPLEPAREFLRRHERYDRRFYTGYLGPVNVGGNTDIYVNLRCMQLTEGHALMYAGAGVTADSVPEKEWEETEMKFNTLYTSLT